MGNVPPGTSAISGGHAGVAPEPAGEGGGPTRAEGVAATWPVGAGAEAAPAAAPEPMMPRRNHAPTPTPASATPMASDRARILRSPAAPPPGVERAAAMPVPPADARSPPVAPGRPVAGRGAV